MADGPTWSALGLPPYQPAYSALEAAALLFGGNPADYVISTVSSLVADISNSAWYDQYGIGMSVQAPNTDNGDLYTPNVFSAYIRDNSCSERYSDPQAACSDSFINYAFRVNGAVPEPMTTLLLGAGLVGLALRRRAAVAVA